MDEIFNTLMEAIEESAFPLFFAKPEYRRMQHCVEQQMQWLDEHLNEEEKVHLEQLRQAELRMASLEDDANVRIAIAAGIRFALPG